MNRPRFSLRTLAILVTLVCAYLAGWEITSKYAARNQGRLLLWPVRDPVILNASDGIRVMVASSPGPLIMRFDGIAACQLGLPSDKKRVYYVWLCGSMAKLPFESTWK